MYFTDTCRILQQEKPRRPNTGPRSARRGSRRSKQPLTSPASNNSEIHLQEQATEAPPFYIHIECNDFLHRGHKKQKEEDIPVCDCKYIPDDSESMCGERCLNVLTSTECTPEHCPCGDHCKNQRFQHCEYVKSKLFKTDGRGWGLMAHQDIKAGQFIIEYCGEVISCKEARRRSQAYEAAGLRDAFIISLDRFESIDATRKGSIARFINHSCEPNCETRKWTVLGKSGLEFLQNRKSDVGQNWPMITTLSGMVVPRSDVDVGHHLVMDFLGPSLVVSRMMPIFGKIMMKDTL